MPQVYHSTVSALISKYEGHVVEMVDGLCLVAFLRAENAIAWALASQADLLMAPWPEALLGHELCEPMSATVVLQSGQVRGQCWRLWCLSCWPASQADVLPIC